MMALSLILIFASSVAALPGDGNVKLNVFTEWM